jgi:hypothetical protein
MTIGDRARHRRCTYRVVRRKMENRLVGVRVTVTTIVQFTLTRNPGMALNRLSKVGGSKRPSGKKVGTTRRNVKSSGRLALATSHLTSWSEKKTMVLLPPAWISRTETEPSNYRDGEFEVTGKDGGEDTAPSRRGRPSLPLWKGRPCQLSDSRSCREVRTFPPCV